MLSKKYILVNETFIVDHSITNIWKEWVSQNLLFEISKYETVKNLMLNRILTIFNPDGESYAIQFIVPENTYDKILIDPLIQQARTKMLEIFRDKIASFQTQMEIIEAKNTDLQILD